MIDWSKCPDVESVPGRCGGAWVVKGTRVPVQAIFENVMAGCTMAQIASEIFDLDFDQVTRVYSYRYDFLSSREMPMWRARRKGFGLSDADERRYQELSHKRMALFLSYIGHARSLRRILAYATQSKRTSPGD